MPRSWPKRRTGSASPSGDPHTPPRPPKYIRHRYWSPGAELTSCTAEETGICRHNIHRQNNHNTPELRRRQGQFRALSWHVPLIPSHITLRLRLVLGLGPSRLVPSSVVQVRLSCILQIRVNNARRAVFIALCVALALTRRHFFSHHMLFLPAIMVFRGKRPTGSKKTKNREGYKVTPPG